MDAAEGKMQEAIAYCDAYNVISIRALALMFDILTQDGSIHNATHQRILNDKATREAALGRPLTEVEYLRIIAIDRANDANPEWIADVKARKLCIVNGTGFVHGETYDLDKIGLSNLPFRTLQ
jgi:hypothetical protein